LELRKDLAVGEPRSRDAAEVVYLGGGPRLDLRAGVAVGESAHQIEVVLPFALGVVTRRDVDRGEVGVPVAVDELPDVLEVVVPDAFLAELPLEAAEGATDVADVGLR